MRYSRTEAMRLFCLECMGYSDHRGSKGPVTKAEALAEVKKCTDSDCPLFEYRNKGSLPVQFRSPGVVRAQREAARKRLNSK